MSTDFEVAVIGDLSVGWMISSKTKRGLYHRGHGHNPWALSRLPALGIPAASWLTAKHIKAAGVAAHTYNNIVNDARSYLNYLPKAVESSLPMEQLQIDSRLQSLVGMTCLPQSLWELGQFSRLRLPKKKDVLRIAATTQIVVHASKGAADADVAARRFCNLSVEEKARQLLVIDDHALGFSKHKEEWQGHVKSLSRESGLIYVRSRNIWGKNDESLLEAIEQSASKFSGIVVSANLLRQAGIKLSHRRTFEASAQDFVSQFYINRHLRRMHIFDWVVVRLGVTGFIIAHKQGGMQCDKWEFKLVYDPLYVSRDPGTQGHMLDLNAIVVSSIVSICAKSRGKTIAMDKLSVALGQSINTLQKLYDAGYGSVDLKKQPEDSLDWIQPKLYSKTSGSLNVCSIRSIVTAPVPVAINSQWSLLEHGEANEFDIGMDVVRMGLAGAMKKHRAVGFPVFRVGDMEIVNRREIENYRYVQESLKEYVSGSHGKNRDTPFSIAVFGAPGSGKSFGVKQILNDMKLDSNVEKLEFNLTQFRTEGDLVSALIQVRDQNLRGKRPVVFFDEFDCPFPGSAMPLGWIRYFLRPMQDGLFVHQSMNLHIGPAIFVFAGGVYQNFNQFSSNGTDLAAYIRDRLAKLQLGDKDHAEGIQACLLEDWWADEIRMSDSENVHEILHLVLRFVSIYDANFLTSIDKKRRFEDCRNQLLQEHAGDEEYNRLRDEFVASKGPDFVSRLRGHLNIGSIDYERDDEDMKSRVIRRSILLRSLLERKGFIGPSGPLVSNEILQAVMRAPRFKHGVRSMEAVLEMCSSFRGNIYTSGLPIGVQLDMHVDSDYFSASFISQ